MFTEDERREIAAIREKMDDLMPPFADLGARINALQQAASKRAVAPAPFVVRGAAKPFAVTARASAPRPALAPANGSKLPKAERSILTVLAQFGASDKTKVAAVAGYAVSGGGFNNALGALRSLGYMQPGEPLTITDAGQDALGSFTPLPTGEALVQYWLAKLPKAERAILEALCAHYPREMAKEDLAQLAGYEPTGGGFNNALGALRTLELITRGQQIKASDNLFS